MSPAPLALQLLNHLRKKIDVPAVVTRSRPPRRLPDRRPDNVADVAVKPQVNDLDPVPDKFEVDRVDCAVVPIANWDGGENRTGAAIFSFVAAPNIFLGSHFFQTSYATLIERRYRKSEKSSVLSSVSWFPDSFFSSTMADLLDFSGKVVLVTGSSRGIGAEMIKALVSVPRKLRR